jgi:aminopeptidase-like protein
MTTFDISKQMYSWVCDLFPICRSLTGDGNRKTLDYLNRLLDGKLRLYEVPTGYQAFDWTVPQEWKIREAWIKNESDEKIVDFAANNLHLVGYSTPINTTISLDELQQHLYSLPEQPNAIPYVTSYYKERWGFCVTDNFRKTLKNEKYHCFIDSELFDGSLTYADLIIQGETDDEIFLSTYFCHPSMANNELSGPAVTTALIQWLLEKKRRYTYRIIFIPETIGSLIYLSKNFETMKQRTKAGFVVTCVGDDRTYSMLHSRLGNTLADKAALSVLKNREKANRENNNNNTFVEYSFLSRGSDERQYCAPNIDLPVVSIMRTKYGEYPEYHTSLDNLELVTPEGLFGAYDVIKRTIIALEKNQTYQVQCLGEPQLGKRGLYPTISTKNSGNEVRNMMNFIAYCDGKHDLFDIQEKIEISIEELFLITEKLENSGLIKIV